MPRIHEYIGYAVVAIFALGWIWGLGAWAIRRTPGRAYWLWLAIAQVVAGVQALVGVVLLVLGHRPTTWLHYVYGFGPIVVLVIAHSLARSPEMARRPWLPFALTSFICFGLTLRALTTGLGVG